MPGKRADFWCDHASHVPEDPLCVCVCAHKHMWMLKPLAKERISVRQLHKQDGKHNQCNYTILTIKTWVKSCS